MANLLAVNNGYTSSYALIRIYYPKGQVAAHTIYGTVQMQLHTRVRLLACPHACASFCPVTSNGTLVSLTYCTHVLHEGLHTRVCCSSKYICRYVHICDQI